MQIWIRLRLLALLCGFAALSANAVAASFDCGVHGLSEVEKTICRDESLSKLDSDLARAYGEAAKAVGTQGQLKIQQRQWITAVRNACESRECLDKAYRARIAALAASTTSARPALRKPEITTAKYTNQSESGDNSLSNISEPNSSGSDDGYWGIVVVSWGLVVLVGIVLGFTEKVIIFRNYNDLGLVFLAGVSLIIGPLMMVLTRGESLSIIIVGLSLIALAGGLLIYLIVRTFVDNRSIVLSILALVTKLTLSVLFLFNVVSLLSPSGKTQAQRAKSRGSALLWLIFLTPLIIRLVRDKEGVFCPTDVFNRYQRRRIGV